MIDLRQASEEPQADVDLWQALVSLVDRPMVAMRYAVAHTRYWWVPLLMILASLIVLTVVSAPHAVQMAAEQLEAQLSRLNLSEEQMQQASGYMREPDQTRLILTGVGGGLVALILGWVVWATVLHFSALTLGGESVFSGMFSIVAWGAVPVVLRNLTQAIYTGVTGGMIVNGGLAGLVATGDTLTDSANVWWVVLSSIDLFLLWHLLLTTVGFGVVSGFARRKSALTVVIWWVVFKGLGLIPVLLGRGLMSRFMGG